MAEWLVSAGGRQPMNSSHEAITVSSSALGLTAAKYRVATVAGANGATPTTSTVVAAEAFITVDSQPIRFTVDGTTPTSSVGHAAVAGDVIRLIGFDSIRKFQAIRSGASDATLRVTYFTGA